MALTTITVTGPTATRLDIFPLVTATRRVDAVITRQPIDGPKRIRVDVTLPTQ